MKEEKRQTDNRNYPHGERTPRGGEFFHYVFDDKKADRIHCNRE